MPPTSDFLCPGLLIKRLPFDCPHVHSTTCCSSFIIDGPDRPIELLGNQLFFKSGTVFQNLSYSGIDFVLTNRVFKSEPNLPKSQAGLTHVRSTTSFSFFWGAVDRVQRVKALAHPGSGLWVLSARGLACLGTVTANNGV
jgi:hypothetical protein